jgi:FkbM family methyltransferase
MAETSEDETAPEKPLPDLQAAADGSKLLPSFQRNPDGSARFIMVLPAAYHEDPGLSLLARCEALHAGYEFPYRSFLDAHLAPGDVFIDIGAHFGVYALSAATAPAGGVRVLAVEPDPHNLRALKLWTALNKQTETIEIVEAACGAAPGRTKLWFYSTMGHQVAEERPKDALAGAEPVDVPLVTIDRMLAERPVLGEGRLFIKIDVEGTEPEVFEGARETLASGRVAAVIFEKGEAYIREDRLAALEAVAAGLEATGFHLRWFPHWHLPGALMPWVSGVEMGNILAVAPDLETEPVYDGPAVPFPPPPPSIDEISETPYGEAARAGFTQRLIAARASDGWRWCRPVNLAPGAEARADAVADLLPRSGSLLDIGAGAMALFRKLPISVRYTPLDFVRFAKATVLADLNRGQFPDGHWDTAALLAVLEYIHDPEALLRRIRAAADRLILCSDLAAENADAAALARRRAAGYVHDLTEAALRRRLADAGWTIETARPSEAGFIIAAV